MRKLVTSRAFRCALCLILVCCIVINCLSTVYANGAAGVIGGVGAAGLGLTCGQVAILLLGALGVYYTVQNADALGAALEYALDEQLRIEEQKAAIAGQQTALLNSWWESAKAGVIELASAPSWIVDTVKDWGSGFIVEEGCIEPIVSVPVFGSVIPSSSSVTLSDGQIVWGSNLRVFKCFSASYINSGYYAGYYQCKIEHIAFNADPGANVYLGSVGNTSSPSNSSAIIDGVCYYYYASGSSGLKNQAYLEQLIASGYYLTDDATPTAVIASYFQGYHPDPVTESVYPYSITGGIASELEKGTGLDVIGLPNIVIPGPDVLPVSPSEGQTDADAITDYLMAALIAGEITWEQYWDLIGVYNPAIGTSVPTVSVVDEETGTIVDTEIGTGTVVTPAPITDFHVDLTSFFPFCIPFDLYEFIRILCAEPEAPVFHWEVQDLSGNVYSVDVDLSPWNSHAQLFRDAQCLLFIIGLLMLTRKFIKW